MSPAKLAPTSDSDKRGIPSLDGLRAISILLVILDHSGSAWLGHSDYFLYPLRDGRLGVSFFFRD